MTKSICDDCLTAHCAQRAPTGGIDPPVMYCTAKTKQKPVTEGDRVRSMPDEELAEWIVHKTEGNGFNGYEERVKAWLDYLSQEVKPDA